MLCELHQPMESLDLQLLFSHKLSSTIITLKNASYMLLNVCNDKKKRQSLSIHLNSNKHACLYKGAHEQTSEVN